MDYLENAKEAHTNFKYHEDTPIDGYVAATTLIAIAEGIQALTAEVKRIADRLEDVTIVGDGVMISGM